MSPSIFYSTFSASIFARRTSNLSKSSIGEFGGLYQFVNKKWLGSGFLDFNTCTQRISFLFQNGVMGLQLLQIVLKIFDLILQWYDQLTCIRRARFGFKILNFKAADFFNFSFNKRIKSSNMSLLLEQDRAVKRSSMSAFELLLSIGSSPWSWDWMAARSRSISTLLFPLRLSPRLISSAFNSSVLREETCCRVWNILFGGEFTLLDAYGFRARIHTSVRHRSLQSKLKESSSLERELLQAH